VCNVIICLITGGRLRDCPWRSVNQRPRDWRRCRLWPSVDSFCPAKLSFRWMPCTASRQTGRRKVGSFTDTRNVTVVYNVIWCEVFAGSSWGSRRVFGEIHFILALESWCRGTLTSYFLRNNLVHQERIRSLSDFCWSGVSVLNSLKCLYIHTYILIYIAPKS